MTPLQTLRHHVTGAIERGEAVAIVEHVSDKQRQIDECKASITRLNAEVLRAIDTRNWTTADKLDRQRTAVEKLLTQLRAT